MVHLADATNATLPRSKYVVKVALVYAVVLIIMAVSQLYAFEKFIPLITDYWLPGGKPVATLVAGLIVISEIFALPFLLRMRISPLMRWVGVLCSVLAPIIWLKLALTAVFETTAITNSGMLGEKVVVSVGVVQLVVSLILLGLAIWSVYGQWPALQPPHKK